jgi:hypothetical protein
MMEWLVLAVAANMPDRPDPRQAVQGSWFLSPRRHVVEFCATMAVLAAVFWVTRTTLPQTYALIDHGRFDDSLRWVRRNRPQWREHQKWSWMDGAMAGLLAVSFVMTAVYKHRRNITLSLLQPCYIQAVALLGVCAWSHRSRAQVLFQVALHNTWGTYVCLFVGE